MTNLNAEDTQGQPAPALVPWPEPPTSQRQHPLWRRHPRSRVSYDEIWNAIAVALTGRGATPGAYREAVKADRAYTDERQAEARARLVESRVAGAFAPKVVPDKIPLEVIAAREEVDTAGVVADVLRDMLKTVERDGHVSKMGSYVPPPPPLIEIPPWHVTVDEKRVYIVGCVAARHPGTSFAADDLAEHIKENTEEETLREIRGTKKDDLSWATLRNSLEKVFHPDGDPVYVNPGSSKKKEHLAKTLRATLDRAHEWILFYLP